MAADSPPWDGSARPSVGASALLNQRRLRTRDRLTRALNVVVASIAVVLTAPLMLLVAIAIRITSPGPAIFKQPRVGIDRRQSRGPGSLNGRRTSDQGGRLFTIYKFRTMRLAENDAPQVWAAKEDPRITGVGKLLRLTRLDELPQLFNVLKGDMNIVGPRPEQPAIFAELREVFSHYPDRQQVLPGITGLAQIKLPYDQTLEDVEKKVDLDLKYIQQRSAVEDLMIMARTMPVMVFRKGSM